MPYLGRVITKALTRLLDVIYPPRCIACDDLLAHSGQAGWFCAPCDQTLLAIAASCLRCGRPYDGSPGHSVPEICGACRRSPGPLRRAWSAWELGAAVQDAIHRLKYADCAYIAPVLSRAWRPVGDPDWDVIMPVPLHRRRLRARGYNQASLLARRVGRAAGVHVDYGALRRTRPTRPQVGLARTDRAQNVRGAFRVPRIDAVRGRRILLIDDVMTTGATLRSCGRTLRAAGATSVDAWTVARGA